MRASVNAIRRGEPISKQKKPICRAVHKWIIEYTLKENSNGAYETRAVLNIYEAVCWQEREYGYSKSGVLIMEQGRQSVNDELAGSENWYRDNTFIWTRCNWEMDVIHSIASYLVTNEGGAEACGDVNWLFPSYSKLSGANAGQSIVT